MALAPGKDQMATTAETDAARLANLQVVLAQRTLAGHLSLDQVERFLGLTSEAREKLFVENNGGKPKSEPILQPSAEFMVHVDRSVRPSYLKQCGELVQPELGLGGPSDYSLQTDVEQWIYEKQRHGQVQGNEVFQHLRTGALSSYLGEQDGLAIQKKGLIVFYKLFAGGRKRAFLWGTTTKRQLGQKYVQIIREKNGRVVIEWFWLMDFLGPFDVALRFK